MFASRYFPDRYFAPRYWPKVGLTAVLLEATGEGLAYVPHRVRVAAVSGHMRTIAVGFRPRLAGVRGHVHTFTVPARRRT